MGDQLRLGDVADVNPENLGAGTPSSFEFRYIDLASVTRGRIDWGATSVHRFGRAPSRARRRLREGDVLFGTVRPALRSHAALQSCPSACVASTGFAVVRAREGVSDPGFLAHYLLSDICARQARRVEVGSNYPAVNEADVRRFKVPSFTLNEQQRIAEVLDTAADTIDATLRTVEKLRMKRDGLAAQLIDRGLGTLATGPANVPARWVSGRLGEFIHLQRGFDITRATQRLGSVPVVSSGGPLSFHDKAMVDGPGVVIGRKGKLGDVYYIEGPYWPHDTTLWVTEFGGNLARYVAELLKRLRLERLDAATSVPTLNRNSVHPIPVALPPLEEQERIVDVLGAVDDRIQAEVDLLEKLRPLADGLADDLLSGQVRTGLV